MKSSVSTSQIKCWILWPTPVKIVLPFGFPHSQTVTLTRNTFAIVCCTRCLSLGHCCHGYRRLRTRGSSCASPGGSASIATCSSSATTGSRSSTPPTSPCPDPGQSGAESQGGAEARDQGPGKVGAASLGRGAITSPCPELGLSEGSVRRVEEGGGGEGEGDWVGGWGGTWTRWRSREVVTAPALPGSRQPSTSPSPCQSKTGVEGGEG